MNTDDKIIRIAKRENNLKRKYLVVNVLQGKHVPVIPSDAMKMFDHLAQIIKETYTDEKLLLISFAETATAIGAQIATQLDCYYIQTTREAIKDVDYLFFSEAHSHATEQKLVKNDIDQVITKIDRIIFIEDEVTTGNTIKNIISLLQKEYSNCSINFSIASIINGMDINSKQQFINSQIPLHYLVETRNSDYESIPDQYNGDGKYHKCNTTNLMIQYSIEHYHGLMDARRVLKSSEYKKACNEFWLKIKEKNDAQSIRSILVLGTEEFMYPALYVASKLEEEGYDVRFHATTRSPIMVDEDERYPLHERYELRSLYNSGRITFIYDLKAYDKVYIITDSKSDESTGLNSLLNALKDSGNENISYIRWCQ